MPKRIQRKRTKGWRMPKNAVYVGRGSKFGNPFTFSEQELGARKSAIRAYRCLFEQKPRLLRHQILTILRGNNGRGEAAVDRMRQSLPELRGKDLACWCPLVDKDGKPVPCHADVLLELANPK